MCRACRLLPHGAYTLVPAVLSTLAWFASLSQDGCDYARVTGPIVEEATESKAIPFIEMGLVAYREATYDPDSKSWKGTYTGDCIDYDEDLFTMDGYWKAGKGFAFLAIVLGGGGALFLWFSSCFVFSPGTWRWAGYEVFIASFFQGMQFIWFQNEVCRENDCSLYYGSNLDIAAATLWFVAAMFIFCRYPAPTPKGDDENEQEMQEVDEPNITIIEDDRETDDLELPVDGDAKATMVPIPDAESAKFATAQLVATKVPESDIS